MYHLVEQLIRLAEVSSVSAQLSVLALDQVRAKLDV